MRASHASRVRVIIAAGVVFAGGCTADTTNTPSTRLLGPTVSLVSLASAPSPRQPRDPLRFAEERQLKFGSSTLKYKNGALIDHNGRRVTVSAIARARIERDLDDQADLAATQQMLERLAMRGELSASLVHRVGRGSEFAGRLPRPASLLSGWLQDVGAEASTPATHRRALEGFSCEDVGNALNTATIYWRQTRDVVEATKKEFLFDTYKDGLDQFASAMQVPIEEAWETFKNTVPYAQTAATWYETGAAEGLLYAVVDAANQANEIVIMGRGFQPPCW